MLVTFAVTVVIVGCLFSYRVYAILPSRGRNRNLTKRSPDSTCSLAVFLGSGGHTSEALAMLSGINAQRYKPRQYFVSEGDSLSVKKVQVLERSFEDGSPNSPAYRVVTIPRARRVHQPLWTTPLTAMVSLCSCIYYMTIEPLANHNSGEKKFPDVLVLNGPGTCLMLCIAAYFNKFFGLPAPTIIYVESFARVKALSLSGKLIRPLVDRFIVQWPELVRRHPGSECYGTVV
ncbi:glycosyltransferase family 1 protein [Coprinopsis marcescibilis]|uniref:UDP-N-acetylglucosamine transferase subunit ALG14 n=1 Tax=Coprinopsis marcescibilis TaxID=230819 RepID=A0A5C3KZQ4_COPMA|nr:glycosyltransferase family 1 protein [Coprinopsis marcescibilis]